MTTPWNPEASDQDYLAAAREAVAGNGHGVHFFEVRPAVLDDLPAVHRLLDEAGLIVDGADYSNFSHVTLVAVRAGEVVGMVQALPGKPYAVLTEMAVAREHRGKGYGTRLLQHLDCMLRAYSCTAWVACVDEANTHTLELLDRYAERRGRGVGYLRRF